MSAEYELCAGTGTCVCSNYCVCHPFKAAFCSVRLFWLRSPQSGLSSRTQNNKHRCNATPHGWQIFSSLGLQTLDPAVLCFITFIQVVVSSTTGTGVSKRWITFRMQHEDDPDTPLVGPKASIYTASVTYYSGHQYLGGHHPLWRRRDGGSGRVAVNVCPEDGGWIVKGRSVPATRDGLTWELPQGAVVMLCYIPRCHNHEQYRLLPGFREFCCHRSFCCYICKPIPTAASTTASL